MLIFVDFEASSLRKQSYPIEVGWVDEAGRGEAHLIRPAPGWDEWDETAEAVHGISRQELFEQGEPHDAVCARVIAAFEGNVACASAPTWDGHWLSMLLRAAGRPRHLLRLAGSNEVFMDTARARLGAGSEAAEALVARAKAEIGSQPVTHRALADARREWEIWMAIRSLPEK